MLAKALARPYVAFVGQVSRKVASVPEPPNSRSYSWTFQLIVSLILIGCSGSRPGVTISNSSHVYVAPVTNEPTVRAVHSAVDKMQYSTASAGFDNSGSYVLVALDRQGNRLTITVYPSNGGSTRLEVCIDPGQNEALSQQVIRVIDRELK